LTTMTIDFKSVLNERQFEAVQHIDGPVMIVAGAGSGKTRIITYRIANLIEHGIDAYNILAVTFTNKAAGEMAERVQELTSEKPLISTFHSFGANLLRREIQHLGYKQSFTIYDATDSRRLIKNCVKELNLNPDNYAPKVVGESISKAKTMFRSPDDYAKSVKFGYEKRMAQIYRLYQERLKQNNALDFDDLIVLPVVLFQENPQILKKYQERFRYILIDEYQDTNKCQYKLIKLLAAAYKNICVVGDPDQSIYQWRGADIKNILSFEKDFKGAKVITMDRNYRSTRQILDLANSVIKHNEERKEKELWTDLDDGELPVYCEVETDRDEAQYAAEKIAGAVEKGEIKYSDAAIFFRTNAQSRLFEESFLRNSIPYVVVGNVGFYSRREIKDVLAYLRVLTSTDDDLGLLRIINLPPRGIGKTTIDHLESFAKENNLRLMECLLRVDEIKEIKAGARKKIANFTNLMEVIRKEMWQMETRQPHLFVQSLVDRIDYLSIYSKEPKDAIQDRKENIEGLVSEIAYQAEQDDFTFEHFLQYTALWSETDNRDMSQDRVGLMTIHNAKGLEFPMVFVTGLEKELFPHANALEYKDGLEEERRLFYVGVTRAEKKLYMTSTASRMKFGRSALQEKSRFIKEIPTDMIKTQEAEVVESGNAKKSGWGAKRKNAVTYQEGMKVEHSDFGVGEVLSVNKSTTCTLLKIKFNKDAVPKTLAAQYTKLVVL
jgi:ATP-dependent DNA helicase UvrD/PcrA